MLQYTKNKTCWSEFDRGWLQNFSNMGTKQLECKCSDRKKNCFTEFESKAKGEGGEKNKMLPAFICTLLLFFLCMALIILIGSNGQCSNNS